MNNPAQLSSCTILYAGKGVQCDHQIPLTAHCDLCELAYLAVRMDETLSEVTA